MPKSCRPLGPNQNGSISDAFETPSFTDSLQTPSSLEAGQVDFRETADLDVIELQVANQASRARGALEVRLTPVRPIRVEGSSWANKLADLSH